VRQQEFEIVTASLRPSNYPDLFITGREFIGYLNFFQASQELLFHGVISTVDVRFMLVTTLCHYHT
jgi:hypothetical protein